jgi:hypothetical protein
MLKVESEKVVDNFPSISLSTPKRNVPQSISASKLQAICLTTTMTNSSVTAAPIKHLLTAPTFIATNARCSFAQNVTQNI